MQSHTLQRAWRLLFCCILIRGEKLKWRLRAYEAGADDLINKRIHAEELMLEFDTLISYQTRKINFIEKKEEKIRIISKTMMQETEDYSNHLSFCRDYLNINTHEQLGKLICHFMESWQLEFTLIIESDDKTYCIKNGGMEFSPIEDNLFKHLNNNRNDCHSITRRINSNLTNSESPQDIIGNDDIIFF